MKISITLHAPMQAPQTSITTSEALLANIGTNPLIQSFLDDEDTVEITIKAAGSSFVPVVYRKLEGELATMAATVERLTG